jgi:hypothetical protein
VPADAFLKAMEKDEIPSGVELNEESEYDRHRTKGNPRKLSKKEKAIRRALSKL